MSSKLIKSGLKKCSEYLKEKNYSLALDEVESVLEIESTNYKGRILRGKILVEQKKYSEAEADFVECIRNEPDQLLAYRGLSTLYFQQKLWELYIQVNRKLLDKLPNAEEQIRDDIQLKTLDIARFNEYYPEWSQIIKEIKNEKKKLSFINSQWDTIPFAILKQFQIVDLIDLNGNRLD